MVWGGGWGGSFDNGERLAVRMAKIGCWASEKMKKEKKEKQLEIMKEK